MVAEKKTIGIFSLGITKKNFHPFAEIYRSWYVTTALRHIERTRAVYLKPLRYARDITLSNVTLPPKFNRHGWLCYLLTYFFCFYTSTSLKIVIFVFKIVCVNHTYYHRNIIQHTILYWLIVSYINILQHICNFHHHIRTIMSRVRMLWL